MLSSTAKLGSRLAFGLFEVDLKSGELWKAGYRVKLQMQPFKVLTILLENAGEVVSRDEIQKRVWGPEVSVDFEQSLGGAIKKVREALGDSAENPRFIETLARRGYRFIAPVGELTPPSAVRVPAQPEAPGPQAPDPVAVVAPPAAPPAVLLPAEAPIAAPALAHPLPAARGPRFPLWAMAVVFTSGALLAGGSVAFWKGRHGPQTPLRRISQITEEGKVYTPADPTLETLPGSATDGVRLFTSALEDGRTVLKQISTATGESHTVPIPEEIASPEISALSPDGTKLLVRSHLDATSEQPLWIVPVDGGSAFRVSDIRVMDATWMPSGNDILYSSADKLSIFSLETGQTRAFASVPGRALWLRWSPDGKLLRFTLIDRVSHSSTLWQLGLNEHAAQPVPMDWKRAPDECCGVWTAGGDQFIFQATQNGHTDLWQLTKPSLVPAPLTNGPLSYEAPATGGVSSGVYFFGQDVQSRVVSFDPAHKTLVPLPSFLAHAVRISFSHDRHWVAWTDARGQLWRAHADGTDLVRLTPESMRVFLAVWSPDGSQLAIMARNPGESWLIYTVSASGGNPAPLAIADRNIGDPSFSADGRFLVFGRVPDSMGQEPALRPLKIYELATGKAVDVPSSAGYFSPRWSPDGNYIAAISLDQRNLMLYDIAGKSWKVLSTRSAADPVWAADSKALYTYAYMAEGKPIDRISIPDGRVDEVVSMSKLAAGNTSQYSFAGLTPDTSPIIRTETSDANLYTLDRDR